MRTKKLAKTFAPPALSLAIAAMLLPAPTAFSIEIDLTSPGDTTLHAVPGAVGGNGLVQNFTSHTAGTGVFDPFLTLERDASKGNPNNSESAYNTDGHSALYLDQQRPTWNTYVKLGSLAVVSQNGGDFYAFELDANEPGGSKSTISVDNVRIYTSPGDNTGAVQNNEGNLNSLGTLRWAMNDPLKNGDAYNADTWIHLDANLSDQLKKANGGSGWSDMMLYVPVTAFAGAGPDDYLWFYNLNGVHTSADDMNPGAEAGYEEWRAVVSTTTVPEGGSTLMLLSSALVGFWFLAHRRNKPSKA